jgi:hypothetical protein
MTLNFPIALPLVVKGLLEGICILGMTSCGCGKLPIELCCAVGSAPSSSPLDVIAWLPDSSMAESSSESFKDCREMALGVLGMPEVGIGEGASRLSGTEGGEPARLETFLLGLRAGDDLWLSSSCTELVVELCDTVLDLLLF